MLSKLSRTIKRVPSIPLSNQVRYLQSPTKRDHPGFLDSLAEVYTHPKYMLDLKPYEYREGQLNFYTTMHLGMIICIVVCSTPILLALTCLLWYSATDSAVTWFNRKNIHPNLKVENARDLLKEENPIFHAVRFMGASKLGLKQMFYQEIEAALASKGHK